MLNSADGKTVKLIFKDGQNVVISKQNNDGSYSSELFEFNSVSDNFEFPELPEYSDHLAKVDLDKLGGSIDQTFRDDYNRNMSQLQSTVNQLVDDNLSHRKFFGGMKSFFGNFRGSIIKIINASVAEYLTKNYLNKSDVGNFEERIETRFSNIERKIRNNPDLNGVQPPSYAAGNNNDSYDYDTDLKLQQMESDLNKGGNK